MRGSEIEVLRWCPLDAHANFDVTTFLILFIRQMYSTPYQTVSGLYFENKLFVHHESSRKGRTALRMS